MSTETILKDTLSLEFKKGAFEKVALPSAGFENLNSSFPANRSAANPLEAEAQRDSHPAGASQPERIFEKTKELGGRIGPDPTRYGDWEKNGRCVDF